jgi:hypothetical protein
MLYNIFQVLAKTESCSLDEANPKGHTCLSALIPKRQGLFGFVKYIFSQIILDI